MVSISEQKQIIIPKVKSFLMEKGFTMLANDEVTFIKDEEKRIIKTYFYFSDSGFSGNTLFSITFKIVEEIIVKIGLPNLALIHQDLKYSSLSTIYDNESTYNYTDRKQKIGSTPITPRSRIIKTEDLIHWFNAFKTYINNEGQIFLNKYPDVIALNKKLTELRNAGERSYSKLLLGGIDHLFRALIITAISRDNHFYEMVKTFDSLILQDKYAAWHPYYEKLKLILTNTEPLVNTKMI
ncbi:hypothetical protein [Portibacter marinus]|uniref:hypothetical protein n=1 Tax=Portibacter marinus TaxID=2898660 RepID=UPI001F2FDBAA|nr:hypothetical protein [Portibacter marinus]